MLLKYDHKFNFLIKPIGESVQYQSQLLKGRNLIFLSVESHVFCAELRLISLKMESTSGPKSLAQSRFRSVINLIKIGGVPILNPSVSRLYRMYCVLCYIAEYTTLIAMMLEVCLHTEDFDHSMDAAMVLMLFLGISFVKFYIR